jgi:ACS family hexuronate transporter-like MFS transporter
MTDRAAPFIPHLRWRIIFLFFFATIISYIDRQTLSVNAPYIRRELGLSVQQYSYLVTSFLIAYTIGPTIAGRLVDTIGTRLEMAAAIVWWSVAATLHAFSRGAADLLALRFALGLGEAGTLPSTMRAVAEWFPARERSLATGIFTAGTAIGAVLAVPVVAFLTLTVGWRACFLVTGLAGFVWLLPWWRLYRPPESHPLLSSAERELILWGRPARAPASRVPITTILRVRKAWGVILGRLMVDPVWQFYLPDRQTAHT